MMYISHGQNTYEAEDNCLSVDTVFLLPFVPSDEQSNSSPRRSASEISAKAMPQVQPIPSRQNASRSIRLRLKPWSRRSMKSNNSAEEHSPVHEEPSSSTSQGSDNLEPLEQNMDRSSPSQCNYHDAATVGFTAMTCASSDSSSVYDTDIFYELDASRSASPSSNSIVTTPLTEQSPVDNSDEFSVSSTYSDDEKTSFPTPSIEPLRLRRRKKFGPQDYINLIDKHFSVQQVERTPSLVYDSSDNDVNSSSNGAETPSDQSSNPEVAEEADEQPNLAVTEEAPPLPVRAAGHTLAAHLVARSRPASSIYEDNISLPFDGIPARSASRKYSPSLHSTRSTRKVKSVRPGLPTFDTDEMERRLSLYLSEGIFGQ